MDEVTLSKATWQSILSIGRLGAVVRSDDNFQAHQIDMIERRILRIEMALRRAGIEVEAIELPE